MKFTDVYVGRGGMDGFWGRFVYLPTLWGGLILMIYVGKYTIVSLILWHLWFCWCLPFWVGHSISVEFVAFNFSVVFCGCASRGG